MMNVAVSLHVISPTVIIFIFIISLHRWTIYFIWQFYQSITIHQVNARLLKTKSSQKENTIQLTKFLKTRSSFRQHVISFQKINCKWWGLSRPQLLTSCKFRLNWETNLTNKIVFLKRLPTFFFFRNVLTVSWHFSRITWAVMFKSCNFLCIK
jgi:hypothetical protein